MPWTPEFNGIFCICRFIFIFLNIRVNLPQLILDGDPRTRGSPSRINGGKFTKTIFFVLWIRQMRFHPSHKVPFFQLEHHKLRMPVHVPVKQKTHKYRVLRYTGQPWFMWLKNGSENDEESWKERWVEERCRGVHVFAVLYFHCILFSSLRFTMPFAKL